MQERHIEHKNYINTYVARFLNLLHLALALNSLTIWPFSFDHIGLGVLVYQLTIYPFLAKYAGLIKPFRSAAVCENNILCWDASLIWSICCTLPNCNFDFSGIIYTCHCNISIHGQSTWYGAQSTRQHSFTSEKYLCSKSTWDEIVKILLYFLRPWKWHNYKLGLFMGGFGKIYSTKTKHLTSHVGYAPI
jgi:hypothetical protein